MRDVRGVWKVCDELDRAVDGSAVASGLSETSKPTTGVASVSLSRGTRTGAARGGCTEEAGDVRVRCTHLRTCTRIAVGDQWGAGLVC